MSANTTEAPPRTCRPFVKWAGGKGQLLPQLSALAPSKFERYFEPFLGGGALFFHLMSAEEENRRFSGDVFISDINSELINAYLAIRDGVDIVVDLLTEYQAGYNKGDLAEEYYYNLRSDYRQSCLAAHKEKERIVRAAQLIALNKTAFNGLYRVNGKGEFNVPWGKYQNPTICDSSNLRNVSKALHRSDDKKEEEVTIRTSDYREMLFENAKEGDFIYLDPPYNPTSSTAYFVGYTSSGFSDSDQRELAKVFKQLDERGCKVMLTNSNTSLVRELYASFVITEANSKRSINCKGDKREGHTDLIIRNYCELSLHNGNSSSSSNKKNKEEGGQQQQLSLESFL